SRKIGSHSGSPTTRSTDRTRSRNELPMGVLSDILIASPDEAASISAGRPATRCHERSSRPPIMMFRRRLHVLIFASWIALLACAGAASPPGDADGAARVRDLLAPVHGRDPAK